METLNEVCHFLSTIPKINHGGCGIAALVIHRWLKSRGKKSSIVFFYSNWDDESYEKNRCFIKGENTFGESCSHVRTKYGRFFIDSNGFTLKDPRKHHIIPEDKAATIINRTGVWNPAFDREYTKFIEMECGVDLSDIEIW